VGAQDTLCAAEDVARDSLLCSRILFHLASVPRIAERFVGRCAAFARSAT
jgi:hypothetical protein